MKETEEDGIFPPFVNYAVAKMVSPYTHGMKPTEVRSATNAAIQAIKEAMAALKTIEDVTARVISATCHPALLDPKKEQPKPKKGEPYPLHPNPDKAMGNVAKEFAEVIGLEKKRVAAYKNHIKTAQKRKKKLAVPASSMPLSELKGNQVIRTILEMSDQLRPVLDKIGIGPNSKKEQLEELKKDPIFRSLRSMSAQMKRSAFGENGLGGDDGLGGLGGDDEDDESGGTGEAGKSEFIPPPEPPQEQSNGQYQYQQHPRQNGTAGMYPHPLDLYTDQNQNHQVQPRPVGTNGPWYPHQYPMIPHYPQHPMMVHPHHPMMMHPHQQIMGPLEQKTGLLFGFLDTQGPVFRFLKVAVVIFIGYMLVCAFLTYVLGDVWYLCNVYETVMQILWPYTNNPLSWKSKAGKKQAADIIYSSIKDQLIQDQKKLNRPTAKEQPTERLSELEMERALDITKHAIQSVSSEIDIEAAINKGLNRAAAAAQEDAQKLTEIIGRIQTKMKIDRAESATNTATDTSKATQDRDSVVTKVLQEAASAALESDEALTQRLGRALVKNDAIVGLFPMIGEASKEAMSVFFATVVSSIFFWFFGSETFWLVPVLTAAGGYVLFTKSVQESITKSSSDLLATLSLEKSDHLNLVLLALSSVIGAVVHLSSGASPKQAMTGAMGSFASSINDEVNRKLEFNRYIQGQLATVKAAPGFVLGNYALEKLAGAAGRYF